MLKQYIQYFTDKVIEALNIGSVEFELGGKVIVDFVRGKFSFKNLPGLGNKP